MKCILYVILILCGMAPAVAFAAEAPGNQPNAASVNNTATAAGVNVVASGVGCNEAEATKDALRNAVHQVIGGFLDADTLVKNDDVLRDQILTYSDGYVQKHTLIGQPQTGNNGLVTVTVSALVVKEKLIEKVRAQKITVASLDGASIAGEALTRKDQEKSGGELFKAECRDVFTGLIKTEVVGKPTYDKEKKELKIGVNVCVDQSAYKAFVTRLEQKLDALKGDTMHLSPVRTECSENPIERGSHSSKYEEAVSPENMSRLSVLWFLIPSRKEHEDFYLDFVHQSRPNASIVSSVLICEKINRDLSSSQWKLYFVPLDVGSAIADALAQKIVLNVEIKDNSGNRVALFNDTIPLFGPVALRESPYGKDRSHVVIQPFFSNSIGMNGSFSDRWGLTPSGLRMLELRIPFSLPEEKLKDATRIECSIAKASDAKNGTKK